MRGGISIEERAIQLAQYIIDSKDMVRGATKKFGISKVFLSKKNPVVKLGLVIK